MTAAEPERLRSVCPDCGGVFTREDRLGRCQQCQPVRGSERQRPHEPSNRRGYDWRWRQLSERARALQPFCSDCGRTDDLTTDHSPAAWHRRAAGKSIRLMDVDVVCRRCNSERGAARPGNADQVLAKRITVGRLHVLTDRCPVCRGTVGPNEFGNIGEHNIGNGRGSVCPMSGQPFPGQ